MMTFCTLFNSYYIDKGLTLYDSLDKACKDDFMLYVLAMDEKCYEIIREKNKHNLIPISLHDFENEELLQVKKNRSPAEYCWTCTPSLIKYVITKFQPKYCAYIDADMFFYDDPICIIKEMESRSATVQITGHRFYADEFEKQSNLVGQYCVEYNTFKNEERSLNLLNIWVSQCLEHCSIDGDGVYWGDQKYIDNWVRDYDFVIETKNLGAGVAPWNIADYNLITANEDSVKLQCNNNIYNLLFYHFQGISYIDENIANIGVYGRRGIDDKFVDYLYINYLQLIHKNKIFLKDKYGLDVLLKRHPGVKQVISRSLKERIVALFTNFSSLTKGLDYHFKNMFGDKYYISEKKAAKKNIVTF